MSKGTLSNGGAFVKARRTDKAPPAPQCGAGKTTEAAVSKVLKDFRDFIMRGNCLTLPWP